MDEREAKQQVIRAGKELCRSGLIARTWGNVSCRLDGKAFAITASGRDYRTLTEEEVVCVDMEELSYEGQIKPSSELKIHRAVYCMKQDAAFVIHTHQDWASAVSAMGLGQVSFGESYPLIGDAVVCADYGLPGTDRLCENTVKALEISAGQAVILRNHGALCYGSSYEEAFEAAYALEEACGNYLKQLGLGSTREHGTCEKEVAPAVIWNRSPAILHFAEEGKGKAMKPFLDDFAQLAGRKMKVLEKDQKAAEREVSRGKSVIVKGIGAFCTADNADDAKALSMIAEKNAMAALATGKTGAGPLGARDCLIMRRNYLRRYSKLKESKK